MLVAAIMRAGMVPFCISPRSAAPGLANLWLQTSTAAVYVLPDARMQGVLTEALALCGKQLPVLEMPTFDALQGEVDSVVEALPPIRATALDSTALILHSSGEFLRIGSGADPNRDSAARFYLHFLEADL
jgi:hypothetical protein